MSAIRFTRAHEWLSVDGDIVTVGITNFAQEQLGDVVFIELPESGRELAEGEEAAVIESVKAAGEINAPVAGTVIEVNEALAESPNTVNEDPTGTGWFFKLRVDGDIESGEWLDEAAYNTYVEEEC